MKIGVLGGGQLGRMLWEASKNLHSKKLLEVSPLFHDSKNCPAGKAGAEITVGDAKKVLYLAAFFRSVDTFAIENEFLPLVEMQTAWEQVQKSTGTPRPSFKGLEIAQDKLEQKKFFLAEGFPTSPYKEILPSWLDDDGTSLRSLQQQWGGLVLKTARMGYDGKGNFALPPNTAFDFSAVQSFCEKAFANGSRVYAEKFVPFEREVALVSARSWSGDYGHYPLIETVQKNGVCFLAFTALQSEMFERQAAQIAKHIGERLSLLGTFAVEFFITKNGELLVNEMAPRVHNSGHFTQAAAQSSQFEMHLKSYVQKKFSSDDFRCAPAFAMVNLLGPAGVTKPVQKPTEPCYWYDKEMTSPGRKLGHILLQSSHQGDLPSLLTALQESERRWQESLQRP